MVVHKIIYLAGGFKSGWQLIVKSELNSYIFLDPSLQKDLNPEEYTQWDLDSIRKSDIILANMESTNPGGYALALEVGFAKALEKKIILVDQIQDVQISHYFEMVRQCADYVFYDLALAVNYLKNGVQNKI